MLIPTSPKVVPMNFVLAWKPAALLNTVSRACLVTAIAALGVKTSLQAIAQLGWRPVAMLLAETLWIAAFVFAGVLMLH